MRTLSEPGYDPIERAERVKRSIAANEGETELRRYYRFRADRWYGGIITGDVIGCNLSCVFCWSWRFRDDPRLGRLLSPAEAFSRLEALASERRINKVRVSGGEPTLTRKHLIELIKLFEGSGRVFVLETNGILIGWDESYASDLARLEGLVVRVSIKGCNPEEFHKLTGARPSAFELQLKALENLVNSGLKPGTEVYPAVMIGFSPDERVMELVERLRALHPSFEDVDWEYVFLYPHVERKLKSLGLRPLRACSPSGVPREMV
ncbi:MAG: radical SAM protein [Fervidicoccaceae archaeon]